MPKHATTPSHEFSFSLPFSGQIPFLPCIVHRTRPPHHVSFQRRSSNLFNSSSPLRAHYFAPVYYSLSLCLMQNAQCFFVWTTVLTKRCQGRAVRAYLSVQQPEQCPPAFHSEEVKHRSSVRAEALPETIHLKKTDLPRKIHFRITGSYFCIPSLFRWTAGIGLCHELIHENRKRVRWLHACFARLVRRSATV